MSKNYIMFDEASNLQLFSIINAPESISPLMIKFATFCANDLLYLALLFQVIYWFIGNHTQKQLVLKIVLTNILASLLVFIIGKIDPTTRPFVSGIGHTLITHAPTPSFPSGHMTAFSVFISSFYLAKKHLIALILGIAGLLTAWARVYVGVHFPIDMLGGLLVGIVSAQIMTLVWQPWGKQITGSLLTWYQMIMRRILLNNKETIKV